MKARPVIGTVVWIKHVLNFPVQSNENQRLSESDKRPNFFETLEPVPSGAIHNSNDTKIQIMTRLHFTLIVFLLRMLNENFLLRHFVPYTIKSQL